MRWHIFFGEINKNHQTVKIFVNSDITQCNHLFLRHGKKEYR